MKDELVEKALNARRSLKRARRAVVKLGTNVVMRPNGELAIGRLCGLIEEIVALRRRGCQVIVVTSGAVGLGAGRMATEAALLPQKQACAAVGQVLLMGVYEQAFARFGVPVAQLLLSEDDFTGRRRYLNLRNAFVELLEMDVLPVVNENDTVSTAEIEVGPGRSRSFGDNDRLSALVTSKMDAHVLVLLTDVEGFCEAPGPRKGGKLIPAVAQLEAGVAAAAGGPGKVGRGGMRTKLDAARICTESGSVAVIANGTIPGILDRVFSGEDVGTIFLPKRRLSSRKRWIAFASGVAGTAAVTRGAKRALQEQGASLLFAGITGIEGEFDRGDVVAIVDDKGVEFARGMANHASSTAHRLIGKHTKAVTALTHEPNYDAFVTRDNLVLL